MSTSQQQTGVLWELSRALADLAEQVAPAIVQVHGRPRRPASGVVIAPERVLTTSHSIEWEDGLQVRGHDGRVHPAEAAGLDRGSDLALLRVPGLASAPLLYASAGPRAGEIALLTGRSWSGTQHARLTTVSGLTGPLHTSSGLRIDQVIALPTSVFAGLSGSAVVSTGGALLGVATAGLARGAALAIPAASVQPIVAAIEEHGGIRRGFIGVSSQPVRLPPRQHGSAAPPQGLLVMGIASDSPADRAGLLVGDVIVRFEGAEVAEAEELLARLGPETVGRTVEVQLLRGGTLQSVGVTIGERSRAH